MYKKMGMMCFILSSSLANASPYIGLSSGVIVNTSDNLGYGYGAACCCK